MIDVIFGCTLFILCCAQVYAWSKFHNDKINFNNIWLYISLIIMLIIGMFNYYFVNVIFRMIVVMLLFCICNFLIFRRRINEVFVSTIYGQFLLTLADVICALFVMILFGVNSSSISDNLLMTALGNLLISCLFVFISSLSFIRKFYSKLVNLTDKIKIRSLFAFCLLVIISINYIMVSAFYEIGSILVIIINSILMIIYSFIVYRSIDEKNNALIIKSENKYLMKSLGEYEDMVDRQRVDNHENKNQLLVIKNMIKKNDKDVVDYIDTIVKDRKEDDEALYTRVKTIPTGGLQGIIYQKMLQMKDEKISFSLDVSRDVRKINLDGFSMDDNYKLCKIIGVFLDNAIEESLNIEDNCIMISLYSENGMLVIDIANKFSGSLDIDKIDYKGFTTKGHGHGYGLSLVKKILSETDVFTNERSIYKDVFKQTIKIKIKNT